MKLHSFVKKFILVGLLIILAVSIAVIVVPSSKRPKLKFPKLQVSVKQDKALAYPFGWSDDVLIGPGISPIIATRDDGYILHGDANSGSDGIYLQEIDNQSNLRGADRQIATGASVARIVAGPSGNAYFTWEATSARQIAYARKDPLGLITTTMVNSPSGRQYSPLITADAGGNAFVVWVDNVAGIYAQKVDPQGVFVGPNTLIINGGLISLGAIAVGPNGNLHVVWNRSNQLYYSEYQGGNLSQVVAPTAIIASPYNGVSGMVVNSGNVVNIFTPRNNNAGFTLNQLNGNNGSPIALRNFSYGNVSIRPAIGPDDYIHVAWNEFNNGNYQIYYLRLAPDATVVGAPLQIINGDPNSISLGSLSVNSQNVVIVAFKTLDSVTNLATIHYKHTFSNSISCRAGNVGSPITLPQDVLLANAGSQAVSVGTANAASPNIVIDNNGLSNLVWVDTNIHYQTYDGTTPVSSNILVSNDSSNGNADFPQVVIGSLQQSQPNVYIAWTAQNSNDGYAQSIFYTHYTSGIQNFAPRGFRTGTRSFNPRIASDGVNNAANLGIVWQSTDLGNSTIWFKEVQLNGSNLTNPILVSTAITGASNPDITYDPATGYFYIIWEQIVGGSSQIYGAVVDTGQFTNPLGRVVIPPTALTTSGRAHNPRFAPFAPLSGGSQLVGFPFVWSEDAGAGMNAGINFGSVLSISQTAGQPPSSVSLTNLGHVPNTGVASSFPRMAYSPNSLKFYFYWSETIQTSPSQIIQDRYETLVTDRMFSPLGPARVTLGDTLSQAGANAFALKNDKPQFISQGQNGIRFLPDAFTAGDPNTHDITVSASSPLELVMAVPDYEAPPRNFALYAWRDVPTAATVTTLPLGLGTMCFSPPVTGGQPLKIWNNILNASGALDTRFGTPSYPSSPAPSMIADIASLPSRLGSGTYTLQGIIKDSHSLRVYSVTNAIILHVQ